MGINFKSLGFFFICFGVLHLCGCATVSTKAWNEYSRQGKIASDNNNFFKAEKCYSLALQEAENFGRGRKLSQTLGHLADARFALKKYEEAEQLAVRRIEMDEMIMVTNTLEFAREILFLAETQEALKKFDLAEQNYLRAEAISNQRLSRMAMGFIIAKRARVYTMQGRLEDAEKCFEESKGRLETLQRAQNPTTIQNAYCLIQMANLLNDYALLCEKQEKYKKAEDLLQQSIDILEHQTSKNSPRLVVGLNNLARICAEDKNLKLAEATARRSAAIVERSLSPADPTRIETLQLLTSIQSQQLISEAGTSQPGS